MAHNTKKPKNSSAAKSRTWTYLILLFVVSGALRYYLSCKTVNIPTVYIDEGLYINIARSLFCEGKVLYRAQPIEYVYLIYPIFLMPLFLLPPSVSLYRTVQVYNAILMSTSVFPAYILGRKLNLKEKSALVLAAFTAMIPELALSSFLTAESLYYPVMIWEFVIAAAICTEQQKRKISRYYVLLGLVTGLLYFVKPICVIFGCSFCIIEIIRLFRTGDRKEALRPFAGILLSCATVGTGYLMYMVLFGKTTLLNLYEKQTSDTTLASIPVMIQSVFYHVAGMLIACGGAFIALPLFCRKEYPKEQQRFMNAGITAILASIVGVAVMVVPYNYTGKGITSPIHLRYLMYYVPLILVFYLSPCFSGRQEKNRAATVFFMLITAVTIFPSAFNFFNYQAGIFDSPALNAFYERSGSWMGIILITVSVPFAVYVFSCIQKRKKVEDFKEAGCFILAVFFIVNGIFTYSDRRSAEKSIEENATQLAEYISESDNVLIVTTNNYDDFRGYSLDSHLRKPVQMVVMNDVLDNAVSSGGRYKSWTPYVQAPNTANYPTVDADTLVFDITTSDYVEFADDIVTTAIGGYLIAKIEPEKPFLKTAIASMDGYILNKEDEGSLLVYDEETLERGTVTLSVVMRCYSSDSCEVEFASAGQSERVTLNGQWQEYEVTLPVEECEFFSFTISSNEDICIKEYHTDA